MNLRRLLYRTPSNFLCRYIDGCGREREPYLGVEIPDIPDELGVLDGGDVVDGLGGGGCG